jgi:phenylacetate-coenzyme A ligase PaaK-like adenylate-forming protein
LKHFVNDSIVKVVYNHTNETLGSFDDCAIKLFHFQYEHNPTYQAYCKLRKVIPENVKHTNDIPFLPIQFFKSKIIQTTNFTAQTIFESSGTTGSINSKHFVKDLNIYENAFMQGFKQFYGNEKDYCILGLLPSYLEKGNSSLVYMIDFLIKKSKNTNSGFYLYNYAELQKVLLNNEANNQKTLLIGVTYALLDFAEQFHVRLQNTIVMETGGMKGRRAELNRSQVHKILNDNFGCKNIHSEYGMTELLSQAYSTGNGIFECSKSMKIILRAEDEPTKILNNKPNETIIGAVNIIDLANIYSCAFIATDDLAKLYPNGSFEILGRLENSDIRGCGLMIAE